MGVGDAAGTLFPRSSTPQRRMKEFLSILTLVLAAIVCVIARRNATAVAITPRRSTFPTSPSLPPSSSHTTRARAAIASAFLPPGGALTTPRTAHGRNAAVAITLLGSRGNSTCGQTPQRARSTKTTPFLGRTRIRRPLCGHRYTENVYSRHLVTSTHTFCSNKLCHCRLLGIFGVFKGFSGLFLTIFDFFLHFWRGVPVPPTPLLLAPTTVASSATLARARSRDRARVVVFATVTN